MHEKTIMNYKTQRGKQYSRRGEMKSINLLLILSSLYEEQKVQYWRQRNECFEKDAKRHRLFDTLAHSSLTTLTKHYCLKCLLHL